MKPEHLETLRAVVEYVENMIENKSDHHLLITEDVNGKRTSIINREQAVQLCLDYVYENLSEVLEEMEETT